MKLIALLACLLVTLAAHAGVYVYTGVYQGKDLYVKNPFLSDGVGFCVFEVKVNGKLTSDEVNSSAFAIDLAQFNMSVGQPLEVIIRTKDECEPQLINPNAIAPSSTCKVTNLNLDGSTIQFSTTGETSNLPFLIEQFKWNKWVVVGILEGKGTQGKMNNYSMEVPTTQGMNQFRIRQDDGKGKHYLMEKEISTSQAAVDLKFEKIYDKIEFTGATDYEIFDAYGVLVAEGRGSVVDCAGWPSGMYYLNFDNQFGRIIRKK